MSYEIRRHHDVVQLFMHGDVHIHLLDQDRELASDLYVLDEYDVLPDRLTTLLDRVDERTTDSYRSRKSRSRRQLHRQGVIYQNEEGERTFNETYAAALQDGLNEFMEGTLEMYNAELARYLEEA